MNNTDKAGVKYWDAAHREQGRQLLDPSDRSIRAHGRRQWHDYFVKNLAGVRSNSSLLEVGCGGSRFLPYFARLFGFAVSGLDYSSEGCDQARKILEAESVPGEIVQADLFDPPTALLSRFDVVVSFGLVEHFTNTEACITALARFLRPGGTILTSVPNLCGLVGVFQKMLSRAVYDKHIPLNRAALQRAHQAAGLQQVSSEYVGFVNFAVNITDSTGGTVIRLAKQSLHSCLKAGTGIIWAFESIGMPSIGNSITSPHIVCKALKTVDLLGAAKIG